MRVVFMGTPDFAVAALDAVANAGHELAACVTQGDKPVGRKAVLTPPPVKQRAAELGIPVIQPEKIKDEGFFEQLRSIAPDVIVVAAFGRIIPKSILELPPYGCLNVHASLLPKYRGAAPIQWAIIDGEQTTGVTIMQMNEGLDTGDMLAKREVPIEENETGGSLFNKLATAGGELLVNVLERIETEGGISGEAQGAESPTAYARMIKKEDGRVDWALGAEEIERRVRAFTPWPGAWTTLNGRILKIWGAKVTREAWDPVCNAAGTVLAPGDERKLLVQCGEGILELCIIQAEGKKKMTVSEFLKGHSVLPGTVLGK